MSDIKLKPCPFCGSKPIFPEVKDAYGTWYEAGCEECGIATMSIQIIDYFDYEESPTRAEAHASYCEKEMQYGFHYIGIARDAAIAEWNKRHDDTLTAKVAELEAALSKIERWDQHDIDLAVNQGSNGVRDLYREIARKALKES